MDLIDLAQEGGRLCENDNEYLGFVKWGKFSTSSIIISFFKKEFLRWSQLMNSFMGRRKCLVFMMSKQEY